MFSTHCKHQQNITFETSSKVNLSRGSVFKHLCIKFLRLDTEVLSNQSESPIMILVSGLKKRIYDIIDFFHQVSLLSYGIKFSNLSSANFLLMLDLNYQHDLMTTISIVATKTRWIIKLNPKIDFLLMLSWMIIQRYHSLLAIVDVNIYKFSNQNFLVDSKN